MELRRCLSLVLVTALMMAVSVEGIRLSMSPTTIVDGKTPSLSIRCDTEAPSNDVVYAIKIFKSPSTTYLANVDVVEKTPKVDPSIQQRATATGTVTPAQGSNLVLTFNNAISCNDQGDYSCEYTSDKSSGTMRINQTLQATSDPNNIEMVARPNMFTYNLNETVELMCSGNVGKPVIGTWMWEMKDETFGSTWTSLRPGLTPVDETPTSSSLCQMTGRSTLTFRVRMEDDNLMYRCYFRDSLHSGNFTFQVRDSSSPTPAGSTGNGGAGPAQGSTGMIVGIVLGVLAAIAIVVVLVFFFVIKKKRDKGNDYDTGEGKNGPAAHTEPELHGNPVYTLPSAHTKKNPGAQPPSDSPTLHYADLELVPGSNRPRPAPPRNRDPPTEYASIRIY